MHRSKNKGIQLLLEGCPYNPLLNKFTAKNVSRTPPPGGIFWIHACKTISHTIQLPHSKAHECRYLVGKWLNINIYIYWNESWITGGYNYDTLYCVEMFRMFCLTKYKSVVKLGLFLNANELGGTMSKVSVSDSVNGLWTVKIWQLKFQP